MVMPMMEADPLSQWLDIASTLTDFERLMLIGLMVNQPNLQPAFVNNTLIREPENKGAAENWLRTNLRQLMYFYCKHEGSLELESAKVLFDKADVVKTLATLLVSTYSIPLSIASAFLLWGISRRMTDWCKKYRIQEFGGQGNYVGSFEPGKVSGFMDVKHTPAIEEVEQDVEAAPLNVKFIHVIVPSETVGRIKLKNKQVVDSIAQIQQRGDHQRFDLTDDDAKVKIEGEVARAHVSTAANPDILNFDIAKFEKT